MMIDRCAWVRDRLPLLAGDDWLGPDRRRVERHLIGCPTCRRHFRSYNSLERHMQEHASAPRCSKCGRELRPHESHYYGCP